MITPHTMKKNNLHQGPHKFQHLPKQAGTPIEAVLKALTHSDTCFPIRANTTLILAFSYRSNSNLTSRNSNREFSTFAK